MNDKINQVIEAAIQKPRAQAVHEAVNKLLGENVKAGDTVAVIDDESATVSGFIGKGKVKGFENKDSAYAEVELPNGTVVRCQRSLHIPV
jgi:hypothetical protein